jgi:hypothetical protein
MREQVASHTTATAAHTLKVQYRQCTSSVAANLCILGVSGGIDWVRFEWVRQEGPWVTSTRRSWDCGRVFSA